MTFVDICPAACNEHPWPMAENIYSKGTRVWFEDKDHAWISGEVTSVTKGSDGSIRLVFHDERGKVCLNGPT